MNDVDDLMTWLSLSLEAVHQEAWGDAEFAGSDLAQRYARQVMTDIKAKREILGECRKVIETEKANGHAYPSSYAWALAVTVLQRLALPYADRFGGYREEWRPQP